MMGWYEARQYIEHIDQRRAGATAVLRAYLRGEVDPPRTLRIAREEFIRKHGRPPRYLQHPLRSPRDRKATG